METSASCPRQINSSALYVSTSLISAYSFIYRFEVMAIPRLPQRLDCMLYRRKLEVEIEEIRPELNIVRNASRELRSSPKFRAVLQVNGWTSGCETYECDEIN